MIKKYAFYIYSVNELKTSISIREKWIVSSSPEYLDLRNVWGASTYTEAIQIAKELGLQTSKYNPRK